MPCHTCPRGCSTDCRKPALVVRAHLVFDSLIFPAGLGRDPAGKACRAPTLTPPDKCVVLCRVCVCVVCGILFCIGTRKIDSRSAEVSDHADSSASLGLGKND